MTYKIYGLATASKFLGEVEAESEEEAFNKAKDSEEVGDNSYISLCHQCSEEIDVGDIYEYQVEKS